MLLKYCVLLVNFVTIDESSSFTGRNFSTSHCGTHWRCPVDTNFECKPIRWCRHVPTASIYASRQRLWHTGRPLYNIINIKILTTKDWIYIGCNLQEEVRDLCQRCAKVTRSTVAYPLCCQPRENPRIWCMKFLAFGISKWTTLKKIITTLRCQIYYVSDLLQNS